MSEKKQKFPGQFIGPSYTGRVGRMDCSRTVNMYLEVNALGTGKSDEKAVLIGMPGLELYASVGNGPIRATYTTKDNTQMYVVSGSSVFRLDITSTAKPTVEPTRIGQIRTDSGSVSIADNGKQVLFVDGKYGYYTTISSVIAAATITNIDDPNFYPASSVYFQDGYFILNQVGTAYYFISDLYSIDFLPLNTANKSGSSDLIKAIICNNRELFLLGNSTIEVWWDSGLSGSTPFSRQDGKFSQIGCLAPATVVPLFNTFMWLGQSPDGGAIVYQMQSSVPVRVSNHALEYAIQHADNLQNATAYSWQTEGHYFYVLNIGGDKTWTFDLSTGQWTEQQSNIKGVTARHIVETHCMFNSTHIVGDYQNGNLYFYDHDVYTDNGYPIYKMRQTPHVANNLNRIFYKLLEIDFTPGTALLNGTINEIDPRVILEISNDGGTTWSNPIVAQIGRTGNTLKRARWQRLGSSRDRVFRVSCSDPIRFNLLSCFLDLEEGTS